MLLSDGTPAQFGPITTLELQRKLELRNREGDAYRSARKVIDDAGSEIDRRFPKIIRKVSGYNLPGIRSLGLPDVSTHSLVPLIIGSEGTLAVIAEAELTLVERPKCRGLLVPHFETLNAALEAVGICLEAKPSAVELVDRMLLDLARAQRSLKRTMQAVTGFPEALLMVEMTGETNGEVCDRIEKLANRLQDIAGMTACVVAIDPELRDPMWSLRSAAVPLLYGMPGDRKPITFVEDCAVDPIRMPEFAARFREIFHRHGTDGAFYGHASVGCLHIRPVLNLHDIGDVAIMRNITEDVTDLVLEFNGSLSGEHGDGLVRSEWNRKMFGPVVYGAFQQIKKAFDPDNVLNPGKIVNGPAMEENLRLAPGKVVTNPPTVFDYSEQGGFFRSLELCNGAGVCRKTQGGAMCPSYRATLDENDSTRGRANALRVALTTSGETSVKPGKSAQSPLDQRWIADVMDLCLSCKACKAECPSNVDVAKMKAEFQQAYYAHRPRPLGHWAMKNIDLLSPWAARTARLTNWIGRRRFARGLMEALIGIDRRRSLPVWHRDHFRQWFRKTTKHRVKTGSPVILLDDCFTTYQEPQIGMAAVEVLSKLGFEVELAGLCCGRAMISKGYLTEARTLARRGVKQLVTAARAGVPILGLEPSCLLTLADEWPELVPGEDAQVVAQRAELAESWIARNAGSAKWTASPNAYLFHPHCHQRALVGAQGTVDALKKIPGALVTTLDAGCCGMAGSFGFEKEHYDLSMTIARQGIVPALNINPMAIVVATGTSCRHQIHDVTGRHAVHPVEVLNDSLNRKQK
jgi:Fe-S oxidoreductase